MHNLNRDGNRGNQTLALGVIMIALSAGSTTWILPLAKERTMQMAIPVEETTYKELHETITKIVDGKEVQETVVRQVPYSTTKIVTEAVVVQPSSKERLWLYLMIGIAVFVGLVAVLTVLGWFGFLFTGREPPTILTELLKYFVTAFVGILLGFLGGYNAAAAEAGKPPQPSPAPVSAPDKPPQPGPSPESASKPVKDSGRVTRLDHFTPFGSSTIGAGSVVSPFRETKYGSELTMTSVALPQTSLSWAVAGSSLP